MPTEMIKLMMSLLLKWVILVGLLSLFTILSTVIPEQSIRKNIERSLLSVEKEGDFPEPMIKQRKHGLDYSMDGMIMNQIYTIDNKNHNTHTHKIQNTGIRKYFFGFHRS